MGIEALGAPVQRTLGAFNGKWPTQGEWRYEHLLKLPDDGRRYEIIGGMLYAVSAPSYPHQVTVGELHFHLQRFVNQQGLGAVVRAPCALRLNERAQLLQPDLLVMRGEQSLSDQQVVTERPALVVEVVAPNAERRKRELKFDLYEAAGVDEYWLADLKTCSVEVYTLSNGEYALLGRFAGNEQIRSNVLPGLAIRTKLLFNL